MLLAQYLILLDLASFSLQLWDLTLHNLPISDRPKYGWARKNSRDGERGGRGSRTSEPIVPIPDSISGWEGGAPSRWRYTTQPDNQPKSLESLKMNEAEHFWNSEKSLSQVLGGSGKGP